MAYTTRESGSPYSTDYRIYFKNSDGQAVSPFHDIPLFANSEKTILNMIVEIPRWTNAKMEICTKEALNPIKQDVKKGKVRFVNHCFPYHGYIWNYGALPQTWEDPGHTDAATGCKGDNDPIDACEIGTMVSTRGEVKQVKVLGILAMIDEGETDWKVICIDVNDPVANNLNDIDDVEKHMPGLIKATVDWFRIYKIPAGKPENKFAFNAEAKNKEFAMGVVNETHTFWKDLVMQKTENKEGLACKNLTVANSPYTINQDDANTIINKAEALSAPQAVSDDVHRWHFVNRS
ncbi:predicted protein [Nematostella vectensis]|uniref:Inorganic pyrophosphatase n=2 Tax=Nematostella vectensis TaxID=45351 RepID=A7SNY2_NEMVE|nr:predicted protein [Nematostella vectensis]|eukprot:XP_001626693.1 predicted protein [Nematostella vectensis]